MRRHLLASAIVQARQKLLVVKNNWGIGRIWSLPGGRLEAGEAAADALRREVQEETGLLVEPGDLAYTLDYHNREMGIHFLYFVFPARVTGGKLTVPQQDEHVLDARWIDLAEIDHYLRWDAYREPLVSYLYGGQTRYWRNPDAGLKTPIPDLP